MSSGSLEMEAGERILPLLDLKVEEEGLSPEMRMCLGAGKGKETDPLLESPERNTVLKNLHFSQRVTYFCCSPPGGSRTGSNGSSLEHGRGSLPCRARPGPGTQDPAPSSSSRPVSRAI